MLGIASWRRIGAACSGGVLARAMFFFSYGSTAPRGPRPPLFFFFRGFAITHIRHTTLGRTPLDEGSARRRDLYLTTQQHSQETDIHASGGIRTHDPSKRAAVDPRLRRHGHWDR
jgi:hypothetical protein